MKRLLGVALALVLLALLTPAMPAFGHADYDYSLPARDEVLPEAPARVDVYFKQDIFRQQGSNFVRVFDESDAQVSEGDGVVDDDDRKHISTELPAGLGDGRYIVRWKTLSDEDGDDEEGAFCFYIGVEPTDAQEAECAAFAEVAPTPTEGAAAATSTPAAPGATPTASVPGDGEDDSDDGVPTALIVVAAVAGAAVVVAVAAGAVVWFRRTLE